MAQDRDNGGCCGYGNAPWGLKTHRELVAFKDSALCSQSVVFPSCVICS